MPDQENSLLSGWPGGVPGQPPAQTSGAWSGIDDAQAAHILIVQADLTAASAGACLDAVDQLTAALRRTGINPGFTPVATDRPHQPSVLAGASARLFKGPITDDRDNSGYSPRWGYRVRCPASLLAMQLNRDTEFDAFRTTQQMIAHESDICLLIEADEESLLNRAQAEMEQLARREPVQVRRWHRGTRIMPGNRDPFGFEDGVSNLQYVRASDPQRYAGYLLAREYDNQVDGTYLVFRRYRCFPEREPADSVLMLPGSRGVPERRLTMEQIVGRDRATGLVVDCDTGSLMAAEPDERQVLRAHPQAHIRMANPRGCGYSSFGDPVGIVDARILRRGFPYRVPGPDGDEQGLLFLAFQSEIQERGFEFIHNEWLMSRFNGGPDPLLAPESGLVEPVTGCYYFIPRQQSEFSYVIGDMLRGDTN